jgi:UDP-glucose 4-epimerase
VLAAESDVVEGVYNVASGSETSLLELAQTLLMVMNSDLDVEFGPARTVNSVVRRLADTSAAQRDLGFRTTVGLEEGLRQLVAWWEPLREEIAAGRALAGSR